MVTYNIKKVNGKKKIVWNKGRSRGLEKLKDRIGNIKEDIEKRLQENGKLKIL